MLYGEFPIRKILFYLTKDNLLPAILFRSARRQCDLDVEQLAKTKASTISPQETDALKSAIDKIIKDYGIEAEIIYKHPHYQALIQTAVGAHHAGQLLVWRLLLEELMTRGLLRILVATGTVAAGVDFPARSAVVTSHSRRGQDGYQTLMASEFQQMSGRAGRRGKDSVGVCLVAPGPFCDARILHQVSLSPPEPLRSSYFASPSTVLNLLKFRNVDDLKFTVQRSFASFADRKLAKSILDEASIKESELEQDNNLPSETKKRLARRVRRLRSEANALETRQEELLDRTLQGLRRLGYLEGGGLSEKGDWAAELCTNLVLELGEAISDGLFDDVTMHQLVGMVASLAADPHRVYFSLKPNPISKEIFRHLERIVVRVRDSQANLQQNIDVAVVPSAALTVITWLESKDWLEFAGLIRLAGVAEGDAARLITQTADHLNQVSHLSDSHPELAKLAYEARLSLLKPPLINEVQ
jgi:ATP-dependent RNA helicase HelY